MGECGVWSVWSVGVECVEYEVWGVECGVGWECVECGVWSTVCGVWSMGCECR